MGKILQRNNDIAILEIENDFLRLVCSNYGCTIMQLFVKMQDGSERDVVLGYDTIEEYQPNDLYLGAVIGRTANRIREGTFTINGIRYQLPINNGPNCNHGGITGFNGRIFSYAIVNDSVRFHYFSKDKEEGYPGNLDAYVTYELKENRLVCTYKATTDQDTLINMTNHSYFNLSGEPSYIGSHKLKVHSNQYGRSDQFGLFTGEWRDVAGTPFDFREYKPIDDALKAEDEDLRLGNGIDHVYLFNSTKDQVSLKNEEEDLTLIVSTSLPATQIYTANYLDGRKGKRGKQNRFRDAVCIETSYLPDSIHLEEDSPTLLHADEMYQAVTEFRFEVKKNEDQ